MDRMKELEEATKLAIKWLQEFGNPHQKIIISYDRVDVISEDTGFPVKADD